MKHSRIIKPVTALAVAAGLVGLTLPAAVGAGGGPNTTPSNSADVYPAVAAGDRFAVITRAGVTQRGKGVLSSTRLAPGAYEVRFNRNVVPCIYVASVGDFDRVGTELPGEITTVGRIGALNGVFISTHNSAGVQEDRSFHLYVGCP